MLAHLLDPRRAALLFALLLPACGAPAEPAAAPATPAASPDETIARHAVDVALGSLGKRNFDVHECVPVQAKIVTEAEARAGAPLGELCTMLVGRRADKTWLVAVRAATTAAPSRAGGALALVTVSAGAEGVTHIEYAK
jgi:hypothetical protein